MPLLLYWMIVPPLEKSKGSLNVPVATFMFHDMVDAIVGTCERMLETMIPARIRRGLEAVSGRRRVERVFMEWSAQVSRLKVANVRHSRMATVKSCGSVGCFEF